MGESSHFASRVWLSHKISKVAEKQLIIQLHQTHYILLSFQCKPLWAYFLHNSVAFCPNFLLFSLQCSPITLLSGNKCWHSIFQIYCFRDTECNFVIKTTSFISIVINKCVLGTLLKFKLFKCKNYKSSFKKNIDYFQRTSLFVPLIIQIHVFISYELFFEALAELFVTVTAIWDL